MLYRFRHPRSAHCFKSPQSKLLKCPAEILSIVFEEVEELADAVCLCLADGHLFSIGFPRAVELQKLSIACWAEDRVICLGGYTKDDDYPESIQPVVNAYIKRWPPRKEEADYKSYFSNLAWTRFTKNGFCTFVGEYRCEDDFDTDLSRPDASAYWDLFSPEYDSEQPWVLCNVSKGEYVRAEAVATLTGREHKGPFIEAPINLGHALLSRICWSSDPSISMSYDKDLHRGPWAGDRVAVTALDRLKFGIEWKDVSKEVVDVLCDIWESEYGSSWLEKINRREEERTPCYISVGKHLFRI